MIIIFPSITFFPLLDKISNTESLFSSISILFYLQLVIWVNTYIRYSGPLDFFIFSLNGILNLGVIVAWFLWVLFSDISSTDRVLTWSCLALFLHFKLSDSSDISNILNSLKVKGLLSWGSILLTYFVI